LLGRGTEPHAVLLDRSHLGLVLPIVVVRPNVFDAEAQARTRSQAELPRMLQEVAEYVAAHTRKGVRSQTGTVAGLDKHPGLLEVGVERLGEGSPMKEVKEPRLQALDEIVSLDRWIVSPERAETWARCLTATKPGQGLGLADLGLRPRRMATFYRATYDDPEEEGVAVSSLAIAQAKPLELYGPQEDPYGSPFIGTGRSHALWTRRAVRRIQVHLGVDERLAVDEMGG